MGEMESQIWWYLIGGTTIILMLFGSIFVVGILSRRRIQAEQKFTERIINTTSALIVLFKPSGEIVQTNDAAEAVSQAGDGNESLSPGANFFDTFDFSADTIQQIHQKNKLQFEGVISQTADHGNQQNRYYDWILRPFNKNDQQTLIIGTGIDITDRKHANQALAQKEINLRKLSTQLLRAQEEERGRIAKELHDEQGQALTAIRVNLKELEFDLEEGDEQQIAYRLDDSKAMIEASLSQIRALSHELRPSLLDDVGLTSALRWYTNQLARRTDIRVNFTIRGEEQKLSSDVEIVIYRVVQEACTNIIKHANATQADITLHYLFQDVQVTIEDDGQGFDPEQEQEERELKRGIGLLGMQERINLVHGTFHLDSTPGEGTRISIQIPRGDLNEQD